MEYQDEPLQIWRVYFESPAGPDDDYAIVDVPASGKAHALNLAEGTADQFAWMRGGEYKSFSAVPLTDEDLGHAH